MSYYQDLPPEAVRQIEENAKILAEGNSVHGLKTLPSPAVLKDIVKEIRCLLFPEYFREEYSSPSLSVYSVGVGLDRIYRRLSEQICLSGSNVDTSAATLRFISDLPSIREALLTDVKATYIADPAAAGPEEVIFCYPGFTAMLHYRLAHSLYQLGIRWLPRIISELAHSATGIDIHPGARIGRHFCIDHGTGIVIGQTCRIGDYCRIYQGVTLGAKSIPTDEDGHAVDIPRHPILGNNVTVYSNASILGRITIGDGAIIGGNVWVTEDVPAGARIVQR